LPSHFLLYLLCSFVLLNCAYYILFIRYSFRTVKFSKSNHNYPVSLIVCAKNEAENLKKNIPLWLQQEHSNFEIILINDSSIDETQDVIEHFAENDSRIKIVNVVQNEAFWGNKKYALTLGIKKAEHTRMLFTDADCSPASTNWLQNMSSSFTEEKQLILGYGAYEKSNSLLNLLIRFETFTTALQYFSYAIAGIPYMGVGRNLGYTSTLYYKNKGFMSHIKIPSGDDDLFVNEAATATNTTICDNPDSFTYSTPKKTWKAWLTQKRRHITTAKHYKNKHKFLLGVYYFGNLGFWLTCFISLYFLPITIVLCLLGLRVVFQYIATSKAAVKLSEKNLLFFLPVLEIFLVFTQLTIFIANTIVKPKRWS